jgi:phosphohistidine phosphatase
VKRLLLLRHAHADQPQSGLEDRERPLSARGRAEALDAALCIERAHLQCDAVLSSPALRAQETAVIVAAQLDLAAHLSFEAALYPGSPEALLGPLRRCAQQLNTVLLIGHNPALSELAQRFNDAEPRIELRTGGLCLIDFADRSRWRDPQAQPAAQVTLLR